MVKTNFKTLITLLSIFFTVGMVSAANITYSEEYYSLGEQVDAFTASENINGVVGYSLHYSPNVAAFASLATLRELRRQTILMEKQNELIAEQNELIKNRTLVCIDGVGYYCSEYGWR